MAKKKKPKTAALGLRLQKPTPEGYSILAMEYETKTGRILDARLLKAKEPKPTTKTMTPKSPLE